MECKDYIIKEECCSEDEDASLEGINVSGGKQIFIYILDVYVQIIK